MTNTDGNVIYVTWDRHKVLPDCGIIEINTPYSWHIQNL
jgi:hypothetical protein